MARRRPTSAAARQKISRALKGKKRQGNRAIRKAMGRKYMTGKEVQNAKKAAIGLGVAGGLAGGAALLAKAKKKGAPGKGGTPIFVESPRELTPVGYKAPETAPKGDKGRFQKEMKNRKDKLVKDYQNKVRNFKKGRK